MKKVFLAISMLAVAFGFTACSNEDEAVNNAKKGKATVVAFTENETRTALSGSDTEGYQVVWSEGDKITIGTEAFTIDDEYAGSTTAKFTGTAPAKGTYNALYGIDELVWPAVQTYKEGNVANFPMYASATVDAERNISPLSFKNLGGLLRLTIKVNGESTRKIKSIEVASSSIILAAQFNIKNGEVKFTRQRNSNSIVLDCGSTGVALSDKGTDFYIAMAPNSYSDIKITLTDTEDNVCVKKLRSGSTLVITRSQITKASFIVDEEKFVPGITANSPVGTVGMLDGIEGIVVELNGTNVVVATKNVGATTIDGGAGSDDPTKASCYGDYNSLIMTSNQLIGASGWRLPTQSELSTLISNDKITWNISKHNGAIWQVTDATTLFLPAAGYYDYNNDESTGEVGYVNVGKCGFYMCQKESNYYYALYFDDDKKQIGTYSPLSSTFASQYQPVPSYKCSIRPFHDMPTE